MIVKVRPKIIVIKIDSRHSKPSVGKGLSPGTHEERKDRFNIPEDQDQPSPRLRLRLVHTQLNGWMGGRRRGGETGPDQRARSLK